MTSRKFRIVNEKGLHARASAKFVETVEAHEARATVTKDGMEVSGDSIMGLLMLGASRGTSIECHHQRRRSGETRRCAGGPCCGPLRRGLLSGDALTRSGHLRG
jgi:phosphotransferase system HPr (HPr) family protein